MQVARRNPGVFTLQKELTEVLPEYKGTNNHVLDMLTGMLRYHLTIHFARRKRGNKSDSIYPRIQTSHTYTSDKTNTSPVYFEMVTPRIHVLKFGPPMISLTITDDYESVKMEAKPIEPAIAEWALYGTDTLQILWFYNFFSEQIAWKVYYLFPKQVQYPGGKTSNQKHLVYVLDDIKYVINFIGGNSYKAEQTLKAHKKSNLTWDRIICGICAFYLCESIQKSMIELCESIKQVNFRETYMYDRLVGLTTWDGFLNWCKLVKFMEVPDQISLRWCLETKGTAETRSRNQLVLSWARGFCVTLLLEI